MVGYTKNKGGSINIFFLLQILLYSAPLRKSKKKDFFYKRNNNRKLKLEALIIFSFHYWALVTNGAYTKEMGKFCSWGRRRYLNYNGFQENCVVFLNPLQTILSQHIAARVLFSTQFKCTVTPPFGLPFSERPLAAQCWRETCGKLLKILGKHNFCKNALQFFFI